MRVSVPGRNDRRLLAILCDRCGVDGGGHSQPQAVGHRLQRVLGLPHSRILPFVGIVDENCTWQSAETINCPGQGGTFPLWVLTLFAGAGELTLIAGLGGSNTIAEYVFASGLSNFKPLAANTFTSLGDFGVGCVTFPNTLVLTPAP